MDLECGCRPCDRWCETAKALQFDMKDAAAACRAPLTANNVEEAKAKYATAERALRDHLRGVK